MTQLWEIKSKNKWSINIQVMACIQKKIQVMAINVW